MYVSQQKTGYPPMQMAYFVLLRTLPMFARSSHDDFSGSLSAILLDFLRSARDGGRSALTSIVILLCGCNVDGSAGLWSVQPKSSGCSDLRTCELAFDDALPAWLNPIPAFPGVDPETQAIPLPLSLVPGEEEAILDLLHSVSFYGPVEFEARTRNNEARTNFIWAEHQIEASGIRYPVSGRTLTKTEHAAPGVLQALVHTLLQPETRVIIVGNGFSPLTVELLYALDRGLGGGRFRADEPSAPIHILEPIDRDALGGQLRELSEGFAKLATPDPVRSFTNAFFSNPADPDAPLGLLAETRIFWNTQGLDLREPSEEPGSADLVLSIFGPERESAQKLRKELELLRPCGRLYVGQNRDTTETLRQLFDSLPVSIRTHYDVRINASGFIVYFVRMRSARG